MAKYIPYYEKLQDVRWQRLRLKILEQHVWMCDTCQSGGEGGGASMHVHHSYYRKGIEPWDYPINTYQVLCKKCHELVEDLKNQFEELVFVLPPECQQELISSVLRVIEADGHPFPGITTLAKMTKEYVKEKGLGVSGG